MYFEKSKNATKQSEVFICPSDRQKKSEGESDSECVTRVEFYSVLYVPCASRIPSRKIVPRTDPQRACRDPQRAEIFPTGRVSIRINSFGCKYTWSNQ